MTSPRDFEEERLRREIFGRNFSAVFLEYQVEEWKRLGAAKRAVFISFYPFLLIIAFGGAIHARCYMLFLGRCF